MRRGYEAPSGDTEKALAEIWSEVLGVERVSRWDHYFELEGRSLPAVQMVSRLRQGAGVDLPLGAVFEHPVFATPVDDVLDPQQLARFDPETLERLAGLVQGSESPDNKHRSGTELRWALTEGTEDTENPLCDPLGPL